MTRASFDYPKLTSCPSHELRQQPLGKAIRRALSVGLVAIAPLGVANALQITPNPNTGTITVTGTDSNAYNPFVNNGFIEISVGGTLTNAGTLQNNISFNNNGTLTNAGTLQNDGVMYNRNGGTLTNQTGATLTTNTDFFNYGSLTNQAGATLTNNYGFNNHSTLTNAGTLQNNSFLSNSSSGTLTNQAGATLTNTGTFFNDGTLSNAGSLIITPTGTIAPFNLVSGDTFTQTAGSTLVDGTLTASAIDIQGGTLSGDGTINGPVTIGTGASVSPGNALSSGSLSVNGASFTLNGQLSIALFSAAAFDVLNVAQALSFGPSSLVELQFGFTPSLTDTFTFLQASSVSGFNPASLTVLGLPAGFDYQIITGASSLTLALEAGPQQVPAPSPLSLLLTGLGGLALAERRRRKRLFSAALQ